MQASSSNFDLDFYRSSTSSGSPELILLILDPIMSLLHCEGHIWLCIGQVNAITVDSKPAHVVEYNIRGDQKVSVSYQLLGLKPTTSQDDSTMKFDWRTSSIKEHM